ncbi:MAG: hypothetical protein ACRD9R_24400 [Pyrinomonadaceae bacterium]
MATRTPPPYFPQNPLLPPDPNRAKKFKLAVAGCGLLLLLAVAGVSYLIIYLLN